MRWETGLVARAHRARSSSARSESPHFFTTTDVFFIGLNIGEIAIMALPLTLIVITGEIDLSVASMLGLSEHPARLSVEHHWPIWLAMRRGPGRRRCSAARSTACWSPGSGCPRSR